MEEGKGRGDIRRVREDMSEHNLEVGQTRVRSELPLEELLNTGWIASNVGERSGDGGVAGVILDPGVSADGTCVRVEVVEDDYLSD
jgi:hypothetical protein